MRISIPFYDRGYKIVSISLDSRTKNDLLSENVDFWHIDQQGITEYPGGYFISDNKNAIEGFLQCGNYDVFEIWENGTASRVYNDQTNENLFFVTGKCNSNCIMCPSPEQMRRMGEKANVANMIKIAGHIPSDTSHLTITGGEPFLAGKDLFKLLDYCKKKFTSTEFLILTNGRVFALEEYCRLLKETIPANCTLGIPLHGSTAERHDFITQTTGSFLQTITGLRRLHQMKIRLEIRIVVCRNNVNDIPQMASLIVHELPNIAHVSIMAMEMTGSAFLNKEKVWIPYSQSSPYVQQAVRILAGAGINVMLYNFPLCTVNRQYWTICAKSISSYKVRYADKCGSCDVRESCGGIFAGTLHLEEADLRPIRL